MADRRAAEQRGRQAERQAETYLCSQGYQVLERRYKTSVGEIDLIVRRGVWLVFVEVKQRRWPEQLADSVPVKQRRRIVEAALTYIGHNPEWAEAFMRFDVMLISGAQPLHIESAWDTDI